MTGTEPEGASTFASGREMSWELVAELMQEAHLFEIAHLVDVDGRAEGVVFEQVVVTHTDFTEVTRMVL
jgi:hypothetical protein